MNEYVRKHEAFINANIELDKVNKDLINYHEKRIEWLAHERLAHLMVFLFTLGVFITFFVMAYSDNNSWFYVITLILLVVSIFYMRHYYFLENRLQRWYVLADQMNRLLQADSNGDSQQNIKWC